MRAQGTPPAADDSQLALSVLAPVVERYRQHLADERRLSAETVRAYLANI
jgi:hypothetical protein